MNYDETISNDIPLCRILDCLITDESNKIVLKFLSKYDDDEIIDMFKNSLCFTSIFLLEFIRGLSIDELNQVKRLFRLASRIYDNVVFFFLRQVMMSDLPDAIKTIFKPDFDMKKGTSLDPYRGHLGNESIRNDIELYKYIKSGDIAEFINLMTPDKTLSYMTIGIHRSVFMYRILQNDVFENLDEIHIFLFIRGLLDNLKERRYSYDLVNIIARKLLLSNIMNCAKVFLLTELRTMEFRFVEKTDLLEDFWDIQCCEELLMKLDVFGDGNVNPEDILMCYLSYNPTIIGDIYKEAPEYLEKYLPIGSLPEDPYFRREYT